MQPKIYKELRSKLLNGTACVVMKHVNDPVYKLSIDDIDSEVRAHLYDQIIENAMLSAVWSMVGQPIRFYMEDMHFQDDKK